MSTKLSILICTMPSRATCLKSLLSILNAQVTPEVEILINGQNGTTGSKRNSLLQQAQGDYVVFVDDDDEVSIDYIWSILEATCTAPDCIGISGVITTNGTAQKDWHISKDYQEWHETDGVYYRHTNHLAPVKREIALKVGFPDKTHGEDYVYSMGLRKYLKTEVKIPAKIYHYKYINQSKA